MKLSLSEISTVNATFEEDVLAYAAAGFDGIGVWEMKLPEDDAANVALIGQAGLGVASCVPAVPSILPLHIPGMEGPPKPRDRVDALCASMHRLAAYEPECVLVLTGPAIDSSSRARRHRSSPRGRRRSRRRRRAARPRARPSVAARVRVVRQLDRRHARAARRCRPSSGRAHGRHVQPLGEAPENLAAVAERITGLHVADVPRDPERTDRVLPGEGGVRSAEHVAALRGRGMGRLPRRRDLLDPDRLLGACPWTKRPAARMRPSRVYNWRDMRPDLPDRHGDVPVHRHRGIDAPGTCSSSLVGSSSWPARSGDRVKDEVLPDRAPQLVDSTAARVHVGMRAWTNCRPLGRSLQSRSRGSLRPSRRA